MARIWNELALDAIRRDEPAPTVHARNLFHLSAAMWDAWASFDGSGSTLFADHDAPSAGREDAIAAAAFTVLDARYRNAEGRVETRAAITDALEDLCGRRSLTDAEGALAVGVAAAEAVLDASFADGSNERLDYQSLDYRPVNPPLDPSVPGTDLIDPNRWQPLTLTTAIAQNGLALPGGEQGFIGPHWGFVTPFAIDPDPVNGLPIDPGPPPLLGSASDEEYRRAIVEVIAAGAALAVGEETIDLSPSARGDSALGTDDGAGHAENPETGEPYAPNSTDLADYGRVIAEYWADGPESETPPGHWNVLANEVSDLLAASGDLRIGGEGAPIDRLEWDVKLYLMLNGAAHDAAIAAWGAKAHYDYVRPISIIRHQGGLGQATDATAASYHPDGLPLVGGLIEEITAASSTAGERHEHLRDHVGQIAVLGWRGGPDDPETELSGVGWIRAIEWVPYQRPTFVTPAFAAYVSGHSTFSRAAADVLTAFTGSAYFPGGLAEWTVPEGSLLHEEGPTAPVTLQWATYADAADEAGRSRIYGGIHVPADDIAGRLMGAQVADRAIERALTLFEDR